MTTYILYIEYEKINTRRIFEKCNEVHNNKYDYSLVEYKNTRSKIKIICEEHGIFEQLSKGHKRDECKNNWCIENNVKLLRIKYNQIDKIPSILNEELLNVI